MVNLAAVVVQVVHAVVQVNILIKGMSQYLGDIPFMLLKLVTVQIYLLNRDERYLDSQ